MVIFLNWGIVDNIILVYGVQEWFKIFIDYTPFIVIRNGDFYIENRNTGYITEGNIKRDIKFNSDSDPWHV